MKLFGISFFLALIALSAAAAQWRLSNHDGHRTTAQTAVLQESKSSLPEARPDDASPVLPPNFASLIGALGLLALLRRRRK
jgi:MYXO-CTERM domain-containing protein